MVTDSCSADRGTTQTQTIIGLFVLYTSTIVCLLESRSGLSIPPPSSLYTMAPSSSTNKPIHDLPTPEPESPVRSRKPYKFSTLCATVENPNLKDQHGASSVPIYQTATFKGVAGEYDYTRSGNPTRSHLGQSQLDCTSCASHKPESNNNLFFPCRASSSKNLLRVSWFCRLVRHGRPRHHHPAC